MPELRHLNPVIAEGEFIVGQIERLPRAFLALELGIAHFVASFATRKEVFEGGGKIHKRTFHRALGHFIRPRKLLPAKGVELFLQRKRRRFFSSLILPLPLRPRPIEREASCASSASKIVRLLLCRMKSYAVRFDHLDPFSHLRL